MECCGDIVISALFAGVAYLAAWLLVALSGWWYPSGNELILLMIAGDALFVMFWVLWRLGYLTGERYP